MMGRLDYFFFFFWCAMCTWVFLFLWFSQVCWSPPQTRGKIPTRDGGPHTQPLGVLGGFWEAVSGEEIPACPVVVVNREGNQEIHYMDAFVLYTVRLYKVPYMHGPPVNKVRAVPSRCGPGKYRWFVGFLLGGGGMLRSPCVPSLL